MNREETKMVLKTIVAVYPSFLNGRDAEITVNVWETLFADEPAGSVQAALLAFVSTDTKGFPPSPGQIKERLTALRQRETMTEAQAWAMVLKAIGNGLYGYRQEFDKLPDAVRRAVGAPEQLREWAKMDQDEVNSVVASNFQRTYRARANADRQFSKLPQSVKSFAKLGDIVQNIALPVGESR